MYVENMRSSRGNNVPNQFVIVGDDGTIEFQSYKTIIARKSNGKVYLDKNYYSYSKTTNTYRNQFLNATTKEIETRIKSGEYELIDLN
jgi:predicted ribonuclease YlaK